MSTNNESDDDPSRRLRNQIMSEVPPHFLAAIDRGISSAQELTSGLLAAYILFCIGIDEGDAKATDYNLTYFNDRWVKLSSAEGMMAFITLADLLLQELRMKHGGTWEQFQAAGMRGDLFYADDETKQMQDLFAALEPEAGSGS